MVGIDRRAFMMTAAVASFLPAPGIGALAADGVGLDGVISDRRFAESRAFGSAAEARGIAHWPMAGDVTRIWLQELDPRWRRGAAIVAGLTTRQALFCLEQLARDRGMRVFRRIEHSELLVSWLIQPRSRA